MVARAMGLSSGSMLLWAFAALAGATVRETFGRVRGDTDA